MKDVTVIHDTHYDNMFGHSIKVNWDRQRKEDGAFHVHGWMTPMVEVGEMILCHFSESGPNVFEFVEVKPTGSPKDMFFGFVRKVGVHGVDVNVTSREVRDPRAPEEVVIPDPDAKPMTSGELLETIQKDVEKNGPLLRDSTLECERCGDRWTNMVPARGTDKMTLGEAMDECMKMMVCPGCYTTGMATVVG